MEIVYFNNNALYALCWNLKRAGLMTRTSPVRAGADEPSSRSRQPSISSSLDSPQTRSTPWDLLAQAVAPTPRQGATQGSGPQQALYSSTPLE